MDLILDAEFKHMHILSLSFSYHILYQVHSHLGQCLYPMMYLLRAHLDLKDTEVPTNVEATFP